MLDLDLAHATIKTDARTNKRFSFDLILAGNSNVFAANSEQDKAGWLRAIDSPEGAINSSLLNQSQSSIGNADTAEGMRVWVLHVLSRTHT